MKTISFRDLKKASWLQGYNEIDLLSIDRDDDVHKVLDQLGFDCEFPVSYFPAKHRDLTGHIALGFMAAGEVQCNRKHLTSIFADLTDILVASSFSDTSLTKELAELSGLSRNPDGLFDCNIPDYDEKRAEMPKDQLEEGWELVEAQIRQLEDIRDSIRGSQYSVSGGLKTAAEYKKFNEERKLNEGKYDF